MVTDAVEVQAAALVTVTVIVSPSETLLATGFAIVLSSNVAVPSVVQFHELTAPPPISANATSSPAHIGESKAICALGISSTVTSVSLVAVQPLASVTVSVSI